MNQLASRLIVGALAVLQATGIAWAADHRSVRDGVPPSDQLQPSPTSTADPTLNGVLLGAVIGGGAVIAITLFSDDCRTCAHPPPPERRPQQLPSGSQAARRLDT